MKCLICDKEFNRLGPHITRIHGVSGKEYFDKFLKISGDGECLTCGNQTRSIGLLGYSKYCSSGCVSKNLKIKDKKVNTCRNHYGCDHISHVPSIIEKKKKTCTAIFGYDNAAKSPIIKQKIANTNIIKYGGIAPYVNINVKEKGKETSLKRFGFDHWGKTTEAREKSRHVYIKMVEDQYLNGEPLGPRIGILERSCLDKLQSYINFKIIRNKQMFGFFPDGFISELKIVIEFDEDHHNDKSHQLKDEEKNKIYNRNGLICFRIKKKIWLENENNIISQFKQLIGDYK